MKYLIYISLIIIVFGSCKNENGNFTVSGKVKSAPSNMIYLEELSYTSPDSKIIDSAKVNADGSYTLKGNSPQQNLFVLSFKNNPAVVLVNDATKIKIDFDLNGFHYPEVTGSDATKELYAFIQNYWRKDSLLSVTYYQLDTINRTKTADTNYLHGLEETYTKQLNDADNLIRTFINTSKNPAAICFAIDKAKGMFAPEELSAILENASKRFPQHTGITAFKNAIAQQKQAAENPNASYALLDQQAPDLTMQSANGKNISISDFKGKYLLVDFWASWCAPCRQENPNVVAAYNKFKNKNFAILGVSLDEDKAAWLKAIQDDHLAWAQMSDLKQWESSAVTTYQFEGIPFNVLIDPQGKIIASSLRGDALEQKLTEVLQ